MRLLFHFLLWRLFCSPSVNRKHKEPELRAYLLVNQHFNEIYPTPEPTLEPSLNATLVFTFYPQRTQRSRRFFHEEHDWQLSLLESLQQESVASCSDAPQCLQRFTCITLCRRIGGRYSPKFANGVFLLYLCSWNLRGSHQTIHVVRFIRAIITWILWNQS